MFDRIVDEAAPGGVHTNPWRVDRRAGLVYEPDFATLVRLLGVPLFLRAATTTGAPALALDVWLSYELRRAGLDPDAVWPRAASPRVLPAPIVSLLKVVNKAERESLEKRLTRGSPPTGVAGTNANILGKNYVKQVDVGLSSWATGPEVLISTKRMDSSFGKNAANRVEESYGDAKNLRMRHPMAALGFAYGLRSTIFQKEPAKAEWLVDLLGKLGREDDAYHAVTLIVIEYGDDLAVAEQEDVADEEDPLEAAGIVEGNIDSEVIDGVDPSEADDALRNLPPVEVPLDRIPEGLQPARFMLQMVNRVLDVTPVTYHVEARRRRQEALRA